MKLRCENLNFRLSSNHSIISDFNFNLDAYEKIWIKGNSGVGKSTLLKLLAGINIATNGKIVWGETQFNQLSREELNQFRLVNIAFVHQESHLISNWTIRQNLNLFSDDEFKIKKYLEYFQFKKNEIDKRCFELSGGERQRIALITAFLKQSKIVLFDEPTSHLDNSNTQKFLQLVDLELKDKTVLLVSHDDRMNAFFNKSIEIKKSLVNEN